MRKRKNFEEYSEMEVDNEERKAEIGVDNEDEDMESSDGSEQNNDSDDEITDRPTPVIENPFFDSFHGLSDPDAKERSRAAQVMLFHCLIGPSANCEDAAYAFKRLLNGICSGRAAARQGNASALASFLKIAFQMDKMDEIRGQAESSSKDSSSSLLSYVRDRLIAATDTKQSAGKKRGSEERDYHFGRLFGILGIVRSKILLLPGDADEIKKVASALVSDLIELFWYKTWMREPAAHGITTTLNLFFGSNEKSSQKIGRHLVTEVIVPMVLTVAHNGKIEESDFNAVIKLYCAEQIGIGAYIQSQLPSNDLPFPLDQSIISTKTLPLVGQAMSETSVVVQPRLHFVWDALWCYLTEKADEETSSKMEAGSAQPVSKCSFRNTVPMGEDRAIDVAEAVIQVVVQEKLLRIENNRSNATHERTSLALCIVRSLSGVPFVSSISGPTQIIAKSDAIENVILRKDILKYLFLNVISAGKKKKDSPHMVKPLALKVLESLVESVVQSGDTNRHLAFIKAIITCEPRFDEKTKTKTIAKLIVPSTIATQDEFWGKYFSYLESKFLESCSTEDTLKEAEGYIELIYNSAKVILDKPIEDEQVRNTDIIECKNNITKRVLDFFMATAFFDCSTFVKTSKKNKKKKGSHVFLSSQTITESAIKIQKSLDDGQKIAFPLRWMISMRFFPLLTMFVKTISQESNQHRDDTVLAVLEEICESWSDLESNKAQRFVSVENDDEVDGDSDVDDSPERIVNDLCAKVVDLKEDESIDKESNLYIAKKGCITGISILAMMLHIHRLGCGPNDEMDEDPDADEEEDEDNICSAIADLEAVSNQFFEAETKDSNPLLGLAEICANILSSPLGSGDLGRGAAPKLVDEAVSFAWRGGLILASEVATKEKTLLDNTVVDLLMDAIGAQNNNKDAPDDDDAEMSDVDDSDDSDESGDSDDDMIFSKASKVLGDSDDSEHDEKAVSEDENDESDIELDPSKLQTMLEDDNLDDIEDIALEHHEGADAALAKLIKLKQESRKVGQRARENIEISNQLRCSNLIEILFKLLRRKTGFGKLFQSNIVIQMVVPLLEREKQIGKSAQLSIGGERSGSQQKKKDLLRRLNSLINDGLYKVQLSSMSLSPPADVDVTTELLQHVAKEAKEAKDKEYLSCCSSCLIFLLRMMPSSEELVSLVSTIYEEVVVSWSTQRKYGASFLQNLVSSMPSLALASLFSALISATQNARTNLLKVEAYRLLTILFERNKPGAEKCSEIERIAQAKIRETQDDILEKIHDTLLNYKATTEKKFAKTAVKELKVIFKAFERFLPLVSAPASPEALDSIKAIKSDVSALGEKYNGLNLISVNLVEEADSRLKTLTTAHVTPTKIKAKTSTSGKKSQKKKKKKR